MHAHDELLRRGVRMDDTASCWIAPEVRLERIAPGVRLHPGCRLAGADLSIGPGCELGADGPVVLESCQLGAGVRLRSGCLRHATLLDGVELGPNVHVRSGTLLEEHVSCGHAVGLKQTILMPFVTLGSLINFCDVLMAGGTGPDDHGEVGSSHVHFNFTPHQDKATPSLLGDVPRGVRLDQPAIFLGGQGGLVGPCRIAFGTVLAAGQVWRKDVHEEGQLRFPEPVTGGTRAFRPGVYGSVARRVTSNLAFIGQLLALDQWYRHARSALMPHDAWSAACVAGARLRLSEALEERLTRLDAFAAKIAASARAVEADPRLATPAILAEQRAFTAGWPDQAARLRARVSQRDRLSAPGPLLAALKQAAARRGDSYLARVQALSPREREELTAWLTGVAGGDEATSPSTKA